MLLVSDRQGRPRDDTDRFVDDLIARERAQQSRVVAPVEHRPQLCAPGGQRPCCFLGRGVVGDRVGDTDRP
jgi:hypothetical protein